MKVIISVVGLCVLVLAGCGGGGSTLSLDTIPGVDGLVHDQGVPADVMDAEDVEPADAQAACPVTLAPAPGLVVTTSGAVQGVQGDATWSWRGIPYAQAPVGDLRWRPPEPAGCFEGVFQADQFGPFCPQLDAASGLEFGDEDCLRLNVWSPDANASSELRPVLFFIHGGGNSQGGSMVTLVGGAVIYDGSHLAATTGAVVVTINYRLGPLGFMALPELTAESEHASSGNYGLLDQVLALHWVQDNIAAFGGDPSRVLLFGESAGAVDTCMLLASPAAHGLFAAALMESGSCSTRTLAWAESAYSNWVSEQTECGGEGAERLACLRALDAETLLTALPPTKAVTNYSLTPHPSEYGPLTDGWVLPQTPTAAIESGDYNAVPFMIGTNADEYDAFVGAGPQTVNGYEQLVKQTLSPFGSEVADSALALYPVDSYDSPRAALVDMLSDSVFTCRARRIARLVVGHQKEPVFRYFFTRRPPTPQGPKLAAHGLELVYVFGTAVDIPFYTPDPADMDLSAAIMGYWTRFAAGNPNGADAPQWPAYQPESDPYLRLDVPVSAEAGVHTAKCDFWDDLVN